MRPRNALIHLTYCLYQLVSDNSPTKSSTYCLLLLIKTISRRFYGGFVNLLFTIIDKNNKLMILWGSWLCKANQWIHCGRSVFPRATVHSRTMNCWSFLARILPGLPIYLVEDRPIRLPERWLIRAVFLAASSWIDEKLPACHQPPDVNYIEALARLISPAERSLKLGGQLLRKPWYSSLLVAGEFDPTPY